MTKYGFLMAGLIASALLAAPAVARENHAHEHRLATRAYASTAPGERYVGGYRCYPAPREGAFATQPWDNSNPPCEPAPSY